MSFTKQAFDQNNFAYNAKFYLFIHLQNSKSQDLEVATSQFVTIDKISVYHRQEYNMYIREYMCVFPQVAVEEQTNNMEGKICLALSINSVGIRKFLLGIAKTINAFSP